MHNKKEKVKAVKHAVSSLQGKRKAEKVFCLICNNTSELPSTKKKDQGFRNRVKVLCEFLTLPYTFLTEIISSPICTLCCKLITTIFQLHHSLKMLELKMKFKRDTIIKHLKCQYKLSNVQESEGIAKSAYELKRRIQIALGIELNDGDCQGEEEAEESHSLLQFRSQSNVEVGPVSGETPVANTRRKIIILRNTRGKKIQGKQDIPEETVNSIRIDRSYSLNQDRIDVDFEGRKEAEVESSLEHYTSQSSVAETDSVFEGKSMTKQPRKIVANNKNDNKNQLKKTASHIRSDHYYSLNPDIKIPDGTVIRKCYVRLERLPLPSAHSRINDDQDTIEDFTHSPLVPEFGTENGNEEVETEIVFEELEINKVPVVSVSNDNEKSSDNNPKDLIVAATSTTFKKIHLVQCTYSSHSSTSYCGMWFVDDLERAIHQERFHSTEIKRSARPKLSGNVSYILEGENRKNLAENLNILTDFHVLRPVREISDGTVLRSRSRRVELPKLVKTKTNQFGTNENAKQEVSPPEKEPASDKIASETTVVTDIVVPEESSTIVLPLDPHSRNESDSEIIQIPEQAKSQKSHLTQCLFTDPVSGPCLLWFVGDEAREAHFNRFHSKSFRKSPIVRRKKEKVTYVCPTEGCGKVFLLKKSLREHSYIHMDKYPFSCKKCSAGFVTKSLLQRHTIIHGNSKIKTDFKTSRNSDGLKYICTEHGCGQEFRQLWKLKHHSYSHTGEYPFRCKKCDRGIASYHKLLEHRATHRTQTADSLVFEQKLPRSVKCNFIRPGKNPCSWTFRDEVDKQAHVKRCHLGESMKTSFSCPHCEYSVYRKTNLENHIRKKHMGESAGYVCEICGASFWIQQNLKIHRIRKHGIKGTFVCDFEGCDKSFGGKTELQHHRCDHLGQYPFSCDQCDAGFPLPYLLRKHIRQQHTARVFNFLCKLCPKKFETKGQLAHHHLVHSEERPFACHLCPWTFKQPDKLKRHISDVHTKSRPFLCQECGSDFKSSGHLALHLKFHSSRKKPFVPRNRRLKTPPRTLTQQPVLSTQESSNFDIDIG